MYSAKFESDRGQIFEFSKENGVAADMDLGKGVSVNFGVSQSFSQIGETVETATVGGRPIEVHGFLFGKDIDEKKREMRTVFAPLSQGTLIFQSGESIQCYVQDPPTFSVKKGDGRFSMLLYAPYPYFTGKDAIVKAIGEVEPLFSFPVNYAEPHWFGITDPNRATEVINNSDVPVSFELKILVKGTVSNPVLSDLINFRFVKINATFGQGEVVRLFRNENGILVVEKTATDGSVENILRYLDEDSNPFPLEPGKNLVAITDDYEGAGMTAYITWKEVQVAVYES